MNTIHSFHIPVMGTAFSVDTPIKVAHYGISSVISLVDDALLEDMRKYYCELYDQPYEEITKYQYDYRARRVKAYLNLVNLIVQRKFEAVRSSYFELGSEITKYFEMLSNSSPLKKLYQEMLRSDDPHFRKELQKRLRSLMKPGEIQVNIMTKLDKVNFTKKRQELPSQFSDALSALRGFADSSLNSAIVFSAGINRKLYTYAEQFKDFYMDANGELKKRIILKVSDYRSSLIQGKFFAKKGLWVSEFRIESGLNCGGHAFASDGYLMGPILDEFKKKKDKLIADLHKVYVSALEAKGKPPVAEPLNVSITAQGGIGTALENDFLLNHYDLDATGWASPFLLVPQVTNVDTPTLHKLAEATEDDLYLSPVSPLGVPFNNLKGSTSDLEKERRVEIGRPGSACPKGHLVSNTEFTEKPICTASRQYQKLKLDQLEKLDLDPKIYKELVEAVVAKACICNDLGEAALLKNNLAAKNVKKFSAVCPGPNIAYFSKVATLEEMVGHIYGRLNLLNSLYRPNMFIKELKMYIDYFKKEVLKVLPKPSEKQIAYLEDFNKNLNEGIEYYRKLFPLMVEETQEYRTRALSELHVFKSKLDEIINKYPQVFSKNEHLNI